MPRMRTAASASGASPVADQNVQDSVANVDLVIVTVSCGVYYLVCVR